MERFTTSYNRLTQHLLVGLIIIFALGSCQKALENEAETTLKSNEQEIESYIAGTKLNFQKSSSGLRYFIHTTNPAGKVPELGDEVITHYTLYTVKGVKLDSTSRKDNKPYAVVYGVQNLISGFQEGLSLLKSGEKATLLMPHNLAFGAQSDANLPAYSPIRVELEVVSVRNEEQQIEAYILQNKLKNAEKTASGLRFIPNEANKPNNPKVKSGEVVRIKYVGKLLSGKQFDAGEIPNVQIGAGGYIKGFEEGINKMGVGDRATLIFPSALGYGKQGSGTVIAPYAPLLFEIEVLPK